MQYLHYTCVSVGKLVLVLPHFEITHSSTEKFLIYSEMYNTSDLGVGLKTKDICGTHKQRIEPGWDFLFFFFFFTHNGRRMKIGKSES